MFFPELKKNYSYSILLMTLIVLLLMAPIFVKLLDSHLLVNLIIYLPFLACIFVVSSSHKHFYTVAVIVLLVILTELINQFNFTKPIFLLHHLLTIGLYSYISVLIVIDVLIKQKKVTVDLIAGILSVYIFIGLLFANVYGVIQLLDESAFVGVKFITNDPLNWGVGFIYFSFVTLTTLGYGDISPNTIEAGSFVYFEAMVGQIFLTVLVARLVGMHITQSTSDVNAHSKDA